MKRIVIGLVLLAANVAGVIVVKNHVEARAYHDGYKAGAIDVFMADRGAPPSDALLALVDELNKEQQAK